MSSIRFDFKHNQDIALLKKAIQFALDENDSSLVLDDGTKVKLEWFHISSRCLALEEYELSMDDIESAHSRICDILINLIPETEFSSYGYWLDSVSGCFQKVFHLDYQNGKLSGFDVANEGDEYCSDCDEELIGIIDYKPNEKYCCECGYEYDPIEDLGWVVKIYNNLQVDDIHELK